MYIYSFSLAKLCLQGSYAVSKGSALLLASLIPPNHPPDFSYSPSDSRQFPIRFPD